MWICCWLSMMKRMTNVEILMKRKKSPSGWTAVSFILIDSDLQSRSHRKFCVTQKNYCSPGLGAGSLNKRFAPNGYQ